MSRFPRSSLFYFALVVLLGLVFWFTWQSLQGNQSSSEWSYSDLINNAQSGSVRSLEVNGTDGTAIGTDGKKHSVTIYDCTGGCKLADDLTAGPVQVKFNAKNGGNKSLTVHSPHSVLVIIMPASTGWLHPESTWRQHKSLVYGRSGQPRRPV